MAAAALQPLGEEDLAKFIQVIGRYKFPFAVSIWVAIESWPDQNGSRRSNQVATL